MKKLLLLPLIILLTTSATAQNLQLLLGHWQGSITIQGNQLPIKTHFQNSDKALEGTLKIQGTTLPLQKIQTAQNDSVFFEFTTSVNVAKFKGAFQNDSTIAGQYHQAGQQFLFELKRYNPDKKVAAKPKPYNHMDLIIKNDSIDIGGTLTWPKKEQPNQLVIFISGSGAQDRDESLTPVSDFKPFALLADSLTTSGLATFRYDDRGIGKSTGSFSNASLNTLASDVEAIIDYFSTNSDYHFGSFVLLGHSQGGVVGGNVAAQDKRVDKLILMASPAVSLAKTVVEQVRIANKQKNISESVIAENLKMQRAIFDTLRGSQDFSQIEDTLVKYDIQNYKNSPDSSQRSISNPKEFFRAKVKQGFQYMKSPSYFSFLDYDPAKDLSKLNIPVLVLFGGKDTQVPVEQNKNPIENALKKTGSKYTIKTFKQANHLFQKAKTGAVSEYGQLKPEFIGGFLTTIEEWIKQLY